jgi:RimJ/RimL family protein N-acetyltransferase
MPKPGAKGWLDAALDVILGPLVETWRALLVKRGWVDRLIVFMVRLSDGFVLLRPLTLADTETHLMGEDEALARWLSGGPGTWGTVRAHIGQCIEAWRAEAPWRTFGIADARSGRLAGTIDVNTALPSLAPGVVNLAYGLYPEWRGRGFARRSVALALTFAREAFHSRTAVLRIDPSNVPSIAVARRCGFEFIGEVITHEGLLGHHQRAITADV